MDMHSRFEVQNGTFRYWQPKEESPGCFRMCVTIFTPEHTEELRLLLEKDHQARRQQKLQEIEARMEEQRQILHKLDEEYKQLGGSSPFWQRC